MTDYIKKNRKLLFLVHSSNSTGGAEDDFERLLEYFSRFEDYYLVGFFPIGGRAVSFASFCDEHYFYSQGWFPVLRGSLRDYLGYMKLGIRQYIEMRKLIKKLNIEVAIVNVSVLLFPIILFRNLHIKNIVFIRETLLPNRLRAIYFSVLSKFINVAIGVSKSITNDYLIHAGNKTAITLYSSIEDTFRIYKRFDFSKEHISRSFKNTLASNQHFKILFNGTITERKNQLLALKAINLLKEENIALFFVGFYDERDSYYLDLIKYVLENNLKSKCFFLGPKDKNYVYNLYEVIDIMIITSLSEGFPLVIAETLAFGKPLVSVPVGGITEVIKDGENGLIVNYDENEIADAIIKLKNDKDLYKKLSENGLVTFKNTFNLEKNLAKVKDLVDDI